MPAVGCGSLECQGCVWGGFLLSPCPYISHNAHKRPRAQARQWSGGDATWDKRQGHLEVLGAMGEGPSRAARSIGKEEPSSSSGGRNQGPKHSIKAPFWPQGTPWGGVPSCCSPGRVPYRMRAAFPPGWPCPPSWGRRAGGIVGTGGTVLAGMAGGTPHRTCRRQGTWA